jgi:hypothetical protein
MWANTAISRLQSIVKQGIMELFSKQLELKGIKHEMKDLPEFHFEPIAEESPMDSMKRAVLGYDAGILTLNQTLEVIGMQPESAGTNRKEGTKGKTGELPRTNQQEGMKDE